MKRHFERQVVFCSAFGPDLTSRLLRQLPNRICASSAIGQSSPIGTGDPHPRPTTSLLGLPAACMPCFYRQKRASRPQYIPAAQLPMPICQRSCRPCSSVTTLNLPPSLRMPHKPTSCEGLTLSSQRRIGSKSIRDVISSPRNWGSTPVLIWFLISSTSL